MNTNDIDSNHLKIVGMAQRMENINQHLNRLEADNKNLYQQVKDLTRHLQIHDDENLRLGSNINYLLKRVDHSVTPNDYKTQQSLSHKQGQSNIENQTTVLRYTEYVKRLGVELDSKEGLM